MPKRGLILLFLLMGLIFILMFAVMAYFLGDSTELNCDRSAEQCIIVKRDLLGKGNVVDVIELHSFAGAEVIESQIMLITDRGRIPLVNHNSCSKDIEVINDYVNSKDDFLILKQPNDCFLDLIPYFRNQGKNNS